MQPQMLVTYRGIVARSFTTDIAVWRPTAVEDDLGRQANALALAPLYPGRLDVPRSKSLSDAESTLTGRAVVLANFLALLPWDADVLTTDVLGIGSRRFQVTDVLKPVSDPVACEVLCVEVT